MKTVSIRTGHISDCCELAAKEAEARKVTVRMAFNGTEIDVEPGMSVKWIAERWYSKREIERLRREVGEV